MWVGRRTRLVVITKDVAGLHSKCSVPIDTSSSIVALFGDDVEEGSRATVQDTVTTGSVEGIPREGDVTVGEL